MSSQTCHVCQKNSFRNKLIGLACEIFCIIFKIRCYFQKSLSSYKDLAVFYTTLAKFLANPSQRLIAHSRFVTMDEDGPLSDGDIAFSEEVFIKEESSEDISSEESIDNVEESPENVIVDDNPINVITKESEKTSEFFCDICEQHFVKKYHYTTHMRIHTNKLQYQCKTCSKSFIQKCDLTTHTRIHTGEKPFPCVIPGCGKAFIQKSDLTKHMRVHTGERPYVCDICDKAFIQNGDLTKHYRTHTGLKPYVCHRCSKSFIQSSDLTKHQRKHLEEDTPNDHTCKICDISFKSLADWTKHAKAHSKKAQRVNDKFYACDLCPMSFKLATHLKRHYQKHENEKGQNPHVKKYSKLPQGTSFKSKKIKSTDCIVERYDSDNSISS